MAHRGCSRRQRRLLIGDRDDRGPGGGANAGAADLHPRPDADFRVRRVDRDPGIGVGIKSHVGGAPPAATLDAALIGRLRHVLAEPAARSEPGGLTQVFARGIDQEGCPSHRQDPRRRRGPLPPTESPWSPLDVTKVIPVWPAGVLKWPFKPSSFDVSAPPQLIETATTPGWFRATSTAASNSLVLSDFASTTMMFAPGAIACATRHPAPPPAPSRS